MVAAGADHGTGGVSRGRRRGLRDTGQLPRLSGGLGQAADPVHRGVHDALDRGDPAHARHRSARPTAAAMSAATLAGLTGAALVGLGLYGLLTDPHPLRKILAFNILGSGVFLLFGIIARKGAAAGFAADPVPQAMVITGIVVAVSATGQPLVYIVGGWTPPLGIALRADGFSAVMLVTAALVIAAAGYFARASFSTPPEFAEKRAPLAFWTLLQALWAALSVVFLGGDLLNLYVALELLTFAAVPLGCLDRRPETLVAALRYLLFALFGSVFYLLGAALLYGTYGTLDIILLANRIGAEPLLAPAGGVAAAPMTAGLLAKTPLFPLHLWPPPAPAHAPAPASAVLSALVVKASFFLIVRLWFDVMPGLATAAVTTVLATLGAAAILFGSVLALRQARLKVLIAFHRRADRLPVPHVPPLHRRDTPEGPGVVRWCGV